jgi:chemotaxis protein MotB
MWSVFVLDVSMQDRFGDTRKNWMGDTVQTVIFLASVLMSLALVIGCADSDEQRLRPMQNELERVLHTALRDGDVRMQRTSGHLTVVIAERLLFDAGSHEIKPDAIDVLKQMGMLFKTASLKEIRVAGHADKASASDGSNQYFEKLALSKSHATQTVRVLKGDGVDSQSFIVEWYGDIRPIASNKTEDGRQLNRRIEIVLIAGI